MSYIPPLDANTDRGYGRLEPKFHNPRQAGSVYPYIEVEELDQFEDEESENAIEKKSGMPIMYDPFSSAAIDRFYFVAGNTKLSDCFERTDSVLKEIHALGDSMASIPGAYKNRGPGFGGSSRSSFVPGVNSFKRTGSKRGYFSSPPDVKIDDELILNDDPEDIPVDNIRDLARKTNKLKGSFSVRNSIFNV
tara:strand:+ start:35 stop:610 length:576 start_codon:yes stop_codon:yes gene_type:complete